MDKLGIKMVLESLSNFPRPLDKKGNLDITAFNDLPETKEAIQTLKELGIKNNYDLCKAGFVAASMVLHF
jgi:RNase H-fold protein (predicted Holliday junction resolvase)